MKGKKWNTPYKVQMHKLNGKWVSLNWFADLQKAKEQYEWYSRLYGCHIRLFNSDTGRTIKRHHHARVL